MQPGSLVTPSDKWLEMMYHPFMDSVTRYSPSKPKKGDIYVCKYIYPLGNIDCVETEEGLRIIDPRDGSRIHVSVNLWDELQPPTAIEIEKIISEPVNLVL